MVLNNHPIAERRLTNLEQSLDKDSERAKAHYDYATEIAAMKARNTWYLPHYAVTNPITQERFT